MTKNLFVKIWINCITHWNNSTKSHFSELDGRLCVLLGIAFFVSATAYFLIPYNPNAFKTFLPEPVDLYGMIDSFPQRIAYQIFFIMLSGSAILMIWVSKKIRDPFLNTNWLSTGFGIFVLIAVIISLWTAHLDKRAVEVLLIAILAAQTAYYTHLRWITWTFIVILLISAILPGWIHTPEPIASSLMRFDQHYDAVLYRGRQLAAGHLFFKENPPYYGMIWSTLIGIIAKEKQVPTFATLIRLVQIGQLLCLLVFALAAWFRTRNTHQNNRIVAIVFLAVAILPWLSSDNLAIWCPNQSGLRFLMMPVAICIAFLIGQSPPIWAGVLAGATAGFALLANFETGVAATASLGMAWLIRLRHHKPQVRVYSTISGIIALASMFFLFGIIYNYFFNAWPIPNNIDSLTDFLSIFFSSVGGLAMPFRPLVIVIMAHAGYIFIRSLLGIFDKKITAPDEMTTAIATMLLVWLPYYINRPDDWNLWTFIALYSLLLAPMLMQGRKGIVSFVLASLVVLPIAARNLPYFIIDPIYNIKLSMGSQSGCGGLILPEAFCSHVYERAKTLRTFASKGSIAWSTSLPVLTDQIANTANPFWSGHLFQLSFTKKNFSNVVQKIQREKFDFIFFDDPNDPFLAPRSQEISFNNKLFTAVQNNYCTPKLYGKWLIAKRKLHGPC